MYTESQQQVIRMGAHILSESTIDKDSSVPRLGPSARSGRELEREGGAVPERIDEGRNVIFITFPLVNLFGAVSGQKEIPNSSE